MKKNILKEIGFIIISIMLVAFAYMISGSFFEVWIKDYTLLSIMAILFYLIIGFYRILNHLARKFRNEQKEEE